MVKTPAVMPSLFNTGTKVPSIKKGGVLMKSKHIATYGKKIAFCNFRDYHNFDNNLHKSTIAALIAP